MLLKALETEFAVSSKWILSGQGKPFLVSQYNSQDVAGKILPIPPSSGERNQDGLLAACALISVGSKSPVGDYLEAIADLLSEVEKRYPFDLAIAAAARLVQKALVCVSLEGKSSLTRVYDVVNSPSVKYELAGLLDRLRNATGQPGSKSKLAASLGVPAASLSQWLAGTREPGGNYTLRLLQWVEQEERKQQKESPASATTPAEPKAQVIKQHENENNSGPP